MRTFPEILARWFLLFAAGAAASAAAAEPVTLADVPEGLPEITADEPFAAKFSAAKAGEERRKTLGELLGLQLDDGGRSTAGFLTDWHGLELEEGRPLETRTSDGYGTGLVIVIARELGVPADDPRLRRGIDWIRAHQRQSGKWFTRSPVFYAKNLISNAGSAYCVLALQACGELPAGDLRQAPNLQTVNPKPMRVSACGQNLFERSTRSSVY